MLYSVRIEVEHWLLGSHAEESRGCQCPVEKRQGSSTLHEAKQAVEVNVGMSSISLITQVD